jgi:hypothetical protein
MNAENELSGESEDLLKDDFVNELNEGSSSGSSDESSSDRTATEGHEDEKQLAGEKKGISPLFADFMRHFEEEQTAEGKIRISIDFMRAALSHTGTPRFKDFWEGRRLCLPLFKENIAPKVRSQLWGFYIELSSEAKRLKEILDEQSAFAIEQIELAIQGLEGDLQRYDLILSQSQEAPILPKCVTLQDKEEFYNQIQRELSLLNTLAVRVNSMRKEVVKTEMRIRIKNKLLERLSLCGDQIFPKRKELIKKISQEFKDLHLYSLREEIKQLQSVAKILTLNTHAFTETRIKLSSCWDKIKNREKERKKETQQKKQEFRQNFDLIMEKIKLFAESCMAGMSIEECNRQASEILEFMQTVELGRDEVRILKAEIQKAKQGPFERAQSEELERQKKHQEVEVKRRETINALKEELTTLINQAIGLDVEMLISKRDELHQQFEEIPLAKSEKQIVDRLFKQMKDIIDDKKEKTLLLLSEDDQKALDQLKGILEERKLRRLEIKNQLENYRKLLGGSGFDFEKAMMYREMIEAEKVTLEKINSSVEEIEEKIAEIEG